MTKISQKDLDELASELARRPLEKNKQASILAFCEKHGIISSKPLKVDFKKKLTGPSLFGDKNA